METASTSAAPAADAGSPNDQGTPSQNAGNSAGSDNRQDTQSRQERGAGSSTPDKQEAKSKTKPKAEKTDAQDDHEWEFSDGKKRKRSEVEKRLSEIQAGAQNAWKKHQESEQRVKDRDARLKELGVDVEEFEKDPRAAFRKAAQAALARELEEATLEPAELERRKLKEENDQFKAADAKRQKEEQTKAHQRQVEEGADKIAGLFATALQGRDLPANEGSVWRMASLLAGARKAKQPISMPELAERTKQWVSRDLRNVVKDGGTKALKSLLEPAEYNALREEIRKELLDEQQAKFSPQPPKRSEPKVLTSSRHPNGYITYDEMMSATRRR